MSSEVKASSWRYALFPDLQFQAPTIDPTGCIEAWADEFFEYRHVEVGRIVLIKDGPCAGKLAAIAEIIDHKRVCLPRKLITRRANCLYQALIDGAKTSGVPRQGISCAHVTLTPILIDKLPRGARSGTVEKYWKKADVDAQWGASAWAKKIAAREARRQLSDFDRFKVMVLRKQRRYQVRKAFAKNRKAAK